MQCKLLSKVCETRAGIAVLGEGEEAKKSLLEIAGKECIEDASFVALGARQYSLDNVLLMDLG